MITKVWAVRVGGKAGWGKGCHHKEGGRHHTLGRAHDAPHQAITLQQRDWLRIFCIEKRLSWKGELVLLGGGLTHPQGGGYEMTLTGNLSLTRKMT
jgi:hypothetical protein